MESALPPILALLIAGGVSIVELLTGKYARTFFVLTPRRCWALYVYGLIYALIGLLAMVGLKALVDAGLIQLQGIGLGNPWGQAVAVGFSAKALLHIRLFNATVGAQSFPIGVETIVLLFEPWLLRTIDLDEFNGVRAFLTPRAQKYPDIDDVRQRIRDDVPENLPEQERKAFLADVEGKQQGSAAMELYLRFLGKASFDRVFPLN